VSQLYLGVDPGNSGGIALVAENFAQAWKLDQTEADVADLLRSYAGTVKLGFVEAVHSMPGQGVSSSFKFGRSYGFLRGLLVALKIPFEDVRPQAWQKQMGCLTGGDKNVSKAKAQMLWPDMRITHAIADSLLIAEACRRTCGMRNGEL
jgi:crossover junction endodeoxyribonuclease RuvC